MVHVFWQGRCARGQLSQHLIDFGKLAWRERERERGTEVSMRHAESVAELI